MAEHMLGIPEALLRRHSDLYISIPAWCRSRQHIPFCKSLGSHQQFLRWPAEAPISDIFSWHWLQLRSGEALFKGEMRIQMPSIVLVIRWGTSSPKG